MSWSKRVFCFWLVLHCCGCGYGQDAGGRQAAAPSPEARAAAPETVISLQRHSGGFGVAPAYKLSIDGDGAVTFEGETNTKRKGTATGRISPDDVRRLIAEFEKVGYFSLADRYVHRENCPQYFDDSPAVVTSLTTGGRSKKVVHNTGCKGTETLDKLTALENMIDEVAGAKQWIK